MQSPQRNPSEHTPNSESGEALSQSRFSPKMLTRLAQRIAQELEVNQCLGVSQGDVLRFLDSCGPVRDFKLTTTFLARNVSVYASDLQDALEKRATSSNPITRFFQKRKAFKEFVSERKDFLEQTLEKLHAEGLLQRIVHEVYVPQRHALPRGTLLVASFAPGRLGKVVLQELDRNQQSGKGA